MEEKEVFIGEQRIHVVVSCSEGEPLKGSVVLIHGSWGGAWMWEVYTKALAGAGYCVYALDLRGHGASEGAVEGATMSDYVEDVKNVVNELEVENPIVIGHSMGGLVAVMYAAQHGARGVVSIDGSPTREVMAESKEVTYPAVYMPTDAGMPEEMEEVMMAFPDLDKEQLMMMKKMLGGESGVARSDRKRGVSVSKEALSMPHLFLGAGEGTSVPFGIGIETSTAMADYYGGDLVEVAQATHPGILLGAHAHIGVEAIVSWLEKVVNTNRSE